jgi:hypothetical protein
MRNCINALDINVVVDRNDRAVVVGSGMQHGASPLSITSASYPRAGASATKPGHKSLGRTGSCLLLGKRLHREHQPVLTMNERLPANWRSRRPSFTTTSPRLASIA